MGWGKLKDRMRGKDGISSKHGETETQRWLEEYLERIEKQACAGTIICHCDQDSLRVEAADPEEGDHVAGKLQASLTNFFDSFASRRMFSEHKVPSRILFRGVCSILYSVFDPDGILL
jgi:hypothetical protein